MRHSVQTSIIIPVLNKWQLTENCLRSLAQTLPAGVCEVIVVDNASGDATPQACPALGAELFGRNFHYHRAERNLNFGPASNLGAKMGSGDYLLFLNNDTLAEPGFYEPLLEDFSTYPNVAATGPVLLYPERGPLGPTVQHLGVFVSPLMQVGHLYEGIPAASDLTKKRRFFQVITAACMLVPRPLFEEHGRFDENYVNGFEDVDLCARLWAAGHRMTVNPASRMYHLTSQTPGRHAHEKHNSRYFAGQSLRHLVPDWHVHLAGDGLELRLTPWLTTTPGMPETQKKKLSPLLAERNPRALVDMLHRYPLWHEGYTRLAELLDAAGDTESAYALLLSQARLNPVPEQLFTLLQSGSGRKDERATDFAFSSLLTFCRNFEQCVGTAASMASWTSGIDLDVLASQYAAWLERADEFKKQVYLPFFEKMSHCTRHSPHSPLDDWAYSLWKELAAETTAQNKRIPAGHIRFSVLMPVYNPRAEHLKEAVESLLAQEWPHWELCMVDDASSDPGARPLMEELAARDSRIRMEFRPENGHIAAATNTALAMARHEYTALMDQDDLLSPDALLEAALALEEHPDRMLLYSDEDKLLDNGRLFYPYFKSDWDEELLRGQNFVNHLGIYRTDRLRNIGGFRDGFPGAQDYDMVLRYTENLPANAVAHIPKVLYHWRSHEESTAHNVDAKPESIGSSLRALDEHYARMGIDAKAERVDGHAFFRAVHALPRPAPLVSLIFDLGPDLPLAQAFADALSAKAEYAKREILLVYDAETDLPAAVARWARECAHIRLLPMPGALTLAERGNRAAAEARGAVLGFLGRGITPLTESWLRQLTAHLMQPGVGVIGGRLLGPNGKLLHAGYVAGADGGFFALFRGQSAQDPNYFSWNGLARTVPSVDPRCLFTHGKYFEESGGFDPLLGDAAGIDYCLRLSEKGLRTVITPFANFLLALNAEASWENNGRVNAPALVKKWRGRIPPCHPHLTVAQGNWSMVRPGGALPANRRETEQETASPARKGREAAPRAHGGQEKVVVYTGIFGGYDQLPAVHAPDPEIAYICYTDGLIESDGVWRIRRVAPVMADPHRDSRRVKLLPHLFLADYDISLWVDANFALKKALTAPFIRNTVREHPIACLPHQERDCLYAEAYAILEGGYDDADLVLSQIHKYRSLGFPESFGLALGHFLVRRHNEPHCKIFDDLWWKELIEHSRRDQLSFPFVRWLTRQEVADLPYNCFSNQLYSWGSEGRGGHKKTTPGTRYALGPNSSADGLRVYRPGEYAGSAFLRAAAAFRNALEQNGSPQESFGPLPIQGQTHEAAAARPFFAGARRLLVPERVSPLWLHWALDVQPRLTITCLFACGQPAELVVLRQISDKYPGQLLFPQEGAALCHERGFLGTQDRVLLPSGKSALLKPLTDNCRTGTRFLFFDRSDFCNSGFRLLRTGQSADTLFSIYTLG